MNSSNMYDIVVVGAGYTGLTAAYALSKKGKKVLVLEASSSPGGLAQTFLFKDGVSLEKFYHHWFNNDVYVPELVSELEMDGEIIMSPSSTGIFYDGRIWRLSTPIDLLRFKALSFLDRIRLGMLVLKVRKIKDWHAVEHLSIREWLEPLCGKSVYRVVWEPLVESKFSVYTEAVNAVWMWKKLVLRGSTRNDKGGEELGYFKGGFGRLTSAIVDSIKRNGGEVKFNTRINRVVSDGDVIKYLETDHGLVHGRAYLFTPALPIIADMLSQSSDAQWIASLRRVKYLGNMCLVLRLKKRLSEIYWLNVNDPGFPFVGVIEHTNFDNPKNYKNTHIVYLSRYLSLEDPVWSYSDKEYYDYAMLYLKKMFSHIDESWVLEYNVWRAEYAQPVTERNYSQYVPGHETPFTNGFISTMAQIYPEDRGTNYAIREGKVIAEKIYESIK